MRRSGTIVVGAGVVALAAIAGALLFGDLWLDDETSRAIEVEERVEELHLEIEKLKQAGDDDAVESRIREMVALDPDHPEPYLETVLFHRARQRLGDAPAAMDALGPADGPGRLYGAGLVHLISGRLEGALLDLERALDVYREKGHLAGQAKCHFAIGNVLVKQQQYERALESYEAVPPLYRKLRNRLGLATAYANLAGMERRLGRPALAAEWLRDVAAIRQQLGDKTAEARSWREIGMALQAAGDPDGAIEALGRALALRRETGDLRAVVATLLTRAEIRYATGDTPGAIEDFDEAAEVAHALGDTAGEAHALHRRGRVELAAGRPQEALDSFETVAGLNDRAGNAAGLADARSWIGSALNRLGEHRRARRILEEVLRTARGLDDRRLEAATLTELGVSLFYVGEISGAFLTQQQALAIHGELDDKRGMLVNHGNLAAIHHSLGERRARDAVLRTLELAEQLEDPAAVARAHNNLGVLLLDPSPAWNESDAEGARRELEAAAEGWRALGDPVAVAETEGNLAEAEARIGDVEGAARRATGALAVLEREGSVRGQARLHHVLGGIRLLQGRTREAIQAHREALAIARDRGLHDMEWRARAGLSEALESGGERAEAVEHALLALDAVERSRAQLETDTFKFRYLANRLVLYERAIGLILTSRDGLDGTEQERAALSFQIAERARARGLLDLLAEGRSALRERMSPELRRREEAALDALNAATVRLASASEGRAGESSDAAARAALQEAEDAFEQIQVEIRRAVPAYSELFYPVPATLDRVRGVLRPREILLEYFVGRETSWVWTVDRDRITVSELAKVDGKSLARTVSEMLADFADPAAALSEEHAVLPAVERLASRLLPELPLSTAPTTLIVVPDGALDAFPFEVLPIEDELLIDRYEIGVLPSASILVTLRGNSGPAAVSGFLGVGAPVVVGGDVPRLPFARQELDRVGRLFRASDRDLLLGEGATKTALRARSLAHYRFIHFATHGWLYDDLGASALRLSGEVRDPDSLLTLREIPGLDLSADLVVLSACRSGAGRHYGGEGPVGLTRAFLHAGARSVVVSLWDVSDESTADFMESFYRGLLGGRSPAAALRRAKLDFLYSDRPGRQRPYRWAPFILVGEPGTTVPVNRSAPAPTVLREGE